MVDFVDAMEAVGGVTCLCMVDVADSAQNKDGQLIGCPKSDTVGIEGENLEQHDGIEFESHETAYIFYQEYGRSMGFTTSIKNSRRSKKTKEFIDAKLHAQDMGSHQNRRVAVVEGKCQKTGCKASMHVKRKRDGKWYIHDFMKEQNNELLPALPYHFRIHRNVKLADKNNTDILLAVSERTRKMYVEMFRQYGGNILVVKDASF